MMKTALEVPFPFNMIIILGALGIGMATIALVATEVRKYFTHRNELEAKREMVAQGLSAEEIERVLAAGGAVQQPKPQTVEA